MRKFIYMSVICVAMLGCLSGCGNSDSSDKTTENTTTEITTENTEATKEDAASDDSASESVDVDVKEAADNILNGGDFKDTLATVDNSMALTRLYGLDQAIVEDAAFYTNSNATAEEIAVIKVKDAADIETVKAAYETRIADQKEACKDYLPDEMTKLEDAVIYTNGNYAILCVSNDSSKIETIIEEMFK